MSFFMDIYYYIYIQSGTLRRAKAAIALAEVVWRRAACVAAVGAYKSRQIDSKSDQIESIATASRQHTDSNPTCIHYHA